MRPGAGRRLGGDGSGNRRGEAEAVGGNADFLVIRPRHGHETGRHARNVVAQHRQHLRRNVEAQQAVAFGPDVHLEFCRAAAQVQRPAARRDHASRCLDGLVRHVVDGGGQRILRRDEHLQLRPDFFRREPRGERLVRAEDQVRQHDGVDGDRARAALILPVLCDVARRDRAVERGVDSPLLRAFGEIDRELDRPPRAVVPRLPVVHRQVDGRAQLSRPAQRPAVGRFQHRHFFDAGLDAADEDAECVCDGRLRGNALDAGRDGRNNQRRNSHPPAGK